jgi:hypothetical protein
MCSNEVSGGRVNLEAVGVKWKKDFNDGPNHPL